MLETKRIFSANLQKLCARIGTHSQVARDLRINRQQFARYLNGTTMPRPDLVSRMADYFEVTVSELFNSAETPDITTSTADFGFALGQFDTTPVSETDLPSGMYLLYKQSLEQNGQIIVRIVSIKRENGACIGVMRFGTQHRKALPDIDFSYRPTLTFARTNGFIVAVNIHNIHGALTLCSFNLSTEFNARIKPGLHMVTGRSGSNGPVAGRLVLEAKPRDMSLLAFARKQGVFQQPDVDPAIRPFLDGPMGQTNGIYTL